MIDDVEEKVIHSVDGSVDHFLAVEEEVRNCDECVVLFMLLKRTKLADADGYSELSSLPSAASAAVVGSPAISPSHHSKSSSSKKKRKKQKNDGQGAKVTLQRRS